MEKTATILDLKNQIETNKGFSASELDLYYMGFQLNEDDALVAEFLEIGNNIFMLQSKPEDILHQAKDVISKRAGDTVTHLITGELKNFHYHQIIQNKTIEFQPKQPKFGILQEKKGEEIVAKVYEVRGAGKVEVRKKEEDQARVFLIHEHPDDREEELFGVLKTCHESQNTQENNLRMSDQGSNILENIRMFTGRIWDLIFGGTNIFNCILWLLLVHNFYSRHFIQRVHFMIYEFPSIYLKLII